MPGAVSISGGKNLSLFNDSAVAAQRILVPWDPTSIAWKFRHCCSHDGHGRL
jgi:hypothetical protein